MNRKKFLRVGLLGVLFAPIAVNLTPDGKVISKNTTTKEKKYNIVAYPKTDIPPFYDGNQEISKIWFHEKYAKHPLIMGMAMDRLVRVVIDKGYDMKNVKIMSFCS